MKKIISALLSAAMIATACPMAFAASDIDSHWAKSYISYLNELEIMKPSSNGSYKPNQPVMRAEFMRYLNRAFDFTQKSDINFVDVTQTDANGAATWYYEPVQIAVAHGYITGVGNNKMDPFSNITREQAATIIGRLHKATPTGSASSITFKDKSSISTWAADYIAEAVEAGYLVGYTDGTFKPKNTITRAEFAKILYNYMGTSLGKPGADYTSTDLRSDVKNATISAGCSLSNAEIKGDLYITEGVMNDTVTLTNVTVAGKIIISGGAVMLDGVSAPEMIISTPLNLKPGVTATGATNIGSTEVQSSCTLNEASLDISAGGFSDMVVDGDNKPEIELNAELWGVTVKGEATLDTSSTTTINTLTANAKMTVTGTGSIQKAIINASGSSLEIEPASVELGSGVKATIAGNDTASSNSVSISPPSFTHDIGGKDQATFYEDFVVSSDPGKVTKLVCEDKVLDDKTDYKVTDKGFRLYEKFLARLKEGVHTVYVYFEDDSRGALTLTITNSSKNFVDVEETSFDKYHNSLNYANIPITLQLAKGGTLDSVKFSSTVLERGTDYTYNSTTGTVILNREALEKRSTGTYTITFNVSKGNNPTMKLTVEDSSPHNAVTPTSIDFDSNYGSGGYQDMTVKLSAVDGATLKSIECGSLTLKENWEYRISGSDVILSREALADLGGKNVDYTDLKFVMSKGDDVTLRVNFVTTYAIKVKIIDDLKTPIEGVQVDIAPSGTDAGTPAQTVTTNSEGVATAYVKRASYVITAKHDKFQEPLTKTVEIINGQTITLTAPILENIDIYVTSTTGAKLEGAEVSLGGKTITTGENGLASFQMKRGNYTVRVSCTGYQSASKSISVTQAATERMVLTAK